MNHEVTVTKDLCRYTGVTFYRYACSCGACGRWRAVESQATRDGQDHAEEVVTHFHMSHLQEPQIVTAGHINAYVAGSPRKLSTGQLKQPDGSVTFPLTEDRDDINRRG